MDDMTKEEVKQWLIDHFGIEKDGTKQSEVMNYLVDLLEQEPKTGHWIYENYIWHCSKCGETPKTLGYVGDADFMREHFKYCNHCGCKMEGDEMTDDEIIEISSVQPKARTGHWINNVNGTYTCDHCGCTHSRSNYCPNCGAKMESEGNE